MQQHDQQRQQSQQQGQQEPNPASAKEKAEGSRDHVAPDAKRRTDANQPEPDGKNDSGVEPEIHGHELPGE
jgi:hypothetical protein